MKQAFVTEKYGTLTLSVFTDANPRMLITIDLGLPTFPQFKITLPFPVNEALNSNYIFKCGVGLLVDQFHLFLNEKGFVESIIVETINSLYLALEQYVAENKGGIEAGSPSDTYEIKFGISQAFYQEIQEHLVSNKQAAPYVNHAKEFELRMKQRQLDKSQDTKAKEEAGEVISRFKNNIYKNTPGQLFVTLYDRNGKPAGVARVTNQGLTKFANGPSDPDLEFCDACDSAYSGEHTCPGMEKTSASWKHYVKGEYWLKADNGHFMDCQNGDYNHESYAQETIILGKWDDVKQALEENYLKLKAMKPEDVARETGVEIEELTEEWKELAGVNDPLTSALAWDFQYTSLWTSLSEAKQNELFNNDYDLYKKDIRYFFMKHYNEIRVINNNFEVWKLTSQAISAITSFLFELAGENIDESAELMVEEVSTKRWASVPLGEFINMKHPGQMWRAHGTVLASTKLGFAEFRARELEVGDFFISPDNEDLPMKVLTKEYKSGYVFVEVELEDGRIESRRFDANKVLYLSRNFHSAITASMKVSYVAKCPGHRNSKGELAEWCIKSHDTDKILSSHKSKEQAKKHLQDMYIHKHSLFNPETFTFSRTEFSNKPLPKGMYQFKMDEEKKSIYQESIQLPPAEPEHRASVKTASLSKYAASIPQKLLTALEGLTDEPLPTGENGRRDLHLKDEETKKDHEGYPMHDPWGTYDRWRGTTKLYDVRKRVEQLRKTTGMRLPLMGSGSSRVVLKVNANTVLKLAKNTAGVSQNKAEVEAYNKVETCSMITQIFYYAEDYEWVLSELAYTPHYEEWNTMIKECYGVSERYGDTAAEGMIHMAMSGNFGTVDPESVKDLQYLIRTLGIKPGDLEDDHNWGIVTRRGQMYPVVVDYGFTNEVQKKHYSSSDRNVYMVDQGEGTPQYLNIELDSKFGNWHLRINDSAEAEWIIANIELDTLARPLTAKGRNSWDLERDLKNKIDWHYIMLKKDLKKEIEEGHKPKHSYQEIELDNARLIQEMIYEVERHLGPEQPKTRW